jgi:predicted HicB family RNase H-like nuclease
MNDKDHALLKEKAEKAGMSLSSFIRKKCLEEGGIANLFKRQE